MSINKLSHSDVVNQLNEIHTKLTTSGSNLNRIKEKIHALYEKVKTGSISLNPEEIKDINSRVYRIVLSQETNGKNTEIGEKLADFAQLLAKQAAASVKEGKLKTFQFQEMLVSLFTVPMQTQQTAQQLVELLKSKPRFDFSMFSAEKLEALVKKLDTIKRRNNEQGIPQFTEVEEVLKLCKPILDDNSPHSNTIENAYKTQVQRGRLQEISDQAKSGDITFAIEDAQKLDNKDLFEVCLVAKSVDPNFLQDILDVKNNLTKNQLQSLGAEFSVYVLNIGKAIKTGNPDRVMAAILAPHVKPGKYGAEMVEMLQKAVQKMLEALITHEARKKIEELQEEIDGLKVRKPKHHSPKSKYASVLPEHFNDRTV